MPQLSSTIIDDGLTSRRRGSRPRRDFRRGLRITSAAHGATVGITSRTNANPTCSQTMGIRRSPQITIAARQNTVIARNRRVLTLRMRAGFSLAEQELLVTPIAHDNVAVRGALVLANAGTIGLGNLIDSFCIGMQRHAPCRISRCIAAYTVDGATAWPGTRTHVFPVQGVTKSVTQLATASPP
jgi:hypothetical protein